MQDEMPMPEGAPQEAAAPDESQIVDQIGALMSQLSPEKQMEVLKILGDLAGGKDPNIVDPNAGANGVPLME